jgi:hypothetical protein
MASFVPLNGGFSQSLLGAGTTTTLIDTAKFNEKGLEELHPQESGVSKSILLVIISAIIFVTVVSFYDVLRTFINTIFAKIALEDPNAHNTQQDIDSTEIANKEAILASITFFSLCLILAVLIVGVIYKYLSKK